MKLKSEKRFIYIFFASALLLSGCFNQETAVDKIYKLLENVVSSEKVFEEQQEPLITLEKKEKDNYDQIIGLGMKQYDQIVKLSDEAIKMADERKGYMEKETKSLKESEKKFNKVKDLIPDIKDPELTKLANELYDVMQKRYQAHDELYNEYVEGIKNDKELYLMFKDKNLSIADLEAQVNKVNQTYEKIFTANNQFNQLTDEYNAKKKMFYQKAGINSK
ncbi:YkyA family protein [Neobacillus massiliamazoniensis]|uniref:Putative chromosome partitioning protein n=1 Tax=Neobacillus massiliamazoniensis TaxID=1499688 RepID=A0A0U1NSE7_9BACI|nr:YkyA family protein [Neobacillus massiliamazoniensis]CRK80648.1 putative chromosome partitioning protein [Neobacillus massiliamazoniensis]